MNESIDASSLHRLAQIAVELGDQVLAAQAQSEQARLVAARFFVACLGQFKRGKSTLLNALVGQPLLPIGVVPVTSIVTLIHDGDQPAATVRFTDGRSEPVALDAIAPFIDERRNPENRNNVAIVEIGVPSAILRHGLTLVDTPGLGSVHAANTEATRAFIPRIDVALIVVGPDPPISGAELELILEVSRQAGELIVVLNKADQSSPDQLQEIMAFTRTTIERELGRAVGQIFEVSALERLEQGRPSRDWQALETHLARLAATSRQQLVGTAGRRAVDRLSRRLAVEAALREDALRKPIQELEARVARLRGVLDDLDRSLVELRFLFDAVEADLGRQFEQHRTRFIRENAALLTAKLEDWITASPSLGRRLRALAFEEAHRLASSAIDEWLRTIEPEAHAVYRGAVARLIRIANEYMSRAATDAGDLDGEDLPPEIGFRARPQFHFTSLMSSTGGSPVTWSIDRLASTGIRQRHVRNAAAAYLTHLLGSNSYRVENDLKDRTRESRRWLEGQIRRRLGAALASAERAFAVAAESQQLSAMEVEERMVRIRTLQDELAVLMRR